MRRSGIGGKIVRGGGRSLWLAKGIGLWGRCLEGPDLRAVDDSVGIAKAVEGLLK